MGRNANGLLKSNTDKGDLTVGQLGLHPKAIKMFENPISSWLWEYNDKVSNTLSEFRSQLAKVTKHDTKEISALKRVVEHFKANREQGTEKEFVDYVRRSANSVILGRYKERLLHQGGLASDIVESYAVQRAKPLHVFNSKGDIVSSIGGKGAQVVFDPKKIPANSILTHNHPRSLGESGIRRIGNSFSSDDIRSAIKVNAKEMRAVTPTYTFSIKRPKGGWGVSADEATKAFADANRTVSKQGHNYLNQTKWNESNIARAEVTHFHKVMKMLAKKYGWDYSKKNN